jgi:hypothetical protein
VATQFVVDWQGKPVRLTGERLRHIGERPEMRGLEASILRTIRSPVCVVQSRSDSDTLLYYRAIADTPVGDKLICVVVKQGRGDAFVLTAYLTDRVEKGRLIWPVAS